MRIHPFVPAVVCLVVAGSGSACGTSSTSGGAAAGSLPGNTINGSVMGMNLVVAATSYWIGHPSVGGAQTQIYISDEKLPCQMISAPGWDKTIGTSSQVLEMGLAAAAVSTFTIRTDADANYLGGPYNPSADAGTVTVAEVHPSQNIIGSFDIHFGADTLSGMFNASFCETGVEP